MRESWLKKINLTITIEGKTKYKFDALKVLSSNVAEQNKIIFAIENIVACSA